MIQNLQVKAGARPVHFVDCGLRQLVSQGATKDAGQAAAERL
jgi:hypothetical protein